MPTPDDEFVAAIDAMFVEADVESAAIDKCVWEIRRGFFTGRNAADIVAQSIDRLAAEYDAIGKSFVPDSGGSGTDAADGAQN